MLVVLMMATGMVFAGTNKAKTPSDREFWCGVLYKMAEPVLSNMSRGELQKNMQLELSPTWDGRNRKVAYMECFGRLMAGLAPWLSLPKAVSASSCASGR